jgi:hypothetical protein
MQKSLAVVLWVVVSPFMLSACSGRDTGSPTAPSAVRGAADGGVSANSANAVLHSVTGSGRVTEDGLVFRSSIAAHSKGTGQVSGELVVLLDLRAYGLGKTTFAGKADCLVVEGRSAWIGAVITHSTEGDIVPAGIRTITLVRDLGGNGQDVMHAEPFDPSVSCADRPAVPETLVTLGNYSVR